MKAYTAVFIGHADYDSSRDIAIEAMLLQLVRSGYCRFLCGGMGAFDLACASAVRRLQSRYPHIRLCLVLPNEKWRQLPQGHFDEIISPSNYTCCNFHHAIPLRNCYMVENASAALCYLRRFRGGAYTSWKLAQRDGLLILNV